MKKQKKIVTRFFNQSLTEDYLNLNQQSLTEDYLNLNQDAFKHNKIQQPRNESLLYT